MERNRNVFCCVGQMSMRETLRGLLRGTFYYSTPLSFLDFCNVEIDVRAFEIYGMGKHSDGLGLRHCI